MSTPSAGSGLVPATINLPISNRPAPPSLPPLGPVPLYIAQRVGDFLYAPLTFTCPGICPHSSCFLAVVRSFRQGVVYGAKIRFPHALVMTLLFRSGTLTEKANDIISATYTHARTLGLYAATYKLATCILRHVTRQPNSPFIPLIGGMVGGGLLFGRNTPINTQINMYVMSRIVFGLLRLATNRGLLPEWERGWGYTLFAAVVWGVVMLLFEREAGVLQKSLASSMEYLYHDSDKPPRKDEGLLDWLVRD